MEKQNADDNNVANCSQNNKEKKNWWFHSLSRRRKTQATAAISTTTTTGSSAHDLSAQSNNNNESAALTHSSTGALPKQKTSSNGSDKNVFQRFRKKVSQRFRSLRQHDSACGTTDASAEFTTHSPPYSFNHNAAAAAYDEYKDDEMVPFTNDYKHFIDRKWNNPEKGINRVMYKACNEMLSQVWYWGEISRRDAQKQLTDKPTGSFLVRDSETSGQFTLSFRIVNMTLHYRLEYRDNYWHFEEYQYESVVEMIENILYRCAKNNFVSFVKVPNDMQPPLPVILKYPLSRYAKMPLLQDLCRRVIQRHMQAKEIAKLPVPAKVLEYLSERRGLMFQC